MKVSIISQGHDKFVKKKKIDADSEATEKNGWRKRLMKHRR
jgi:hypothetical protein